MTTRTIQATALFLALAASTAVASAQPVNPNPSPKPMASGAMSSSSSMKTKKKSSLARHGPPMQAAGANGGSTGHMESGQNIPSTTGATH